MSRVYVLEGESDDGQDLRVCVSFVPAEVVRASRAETDSLAFEELFLGRLLRLILDVLAQASLGLEALFLATRSLEHLVEVSLVVAAQVDLVVLFFVAFVVRLADLRLFEVELRLLGALSEVLRREDRQHAFDDEDGVAVLSDGVEEDGHVEVRDDLRAVRVEAVQVVPDAVHFAQSDPVVRVVADVRFEGGDVAALHALRHRGDQSTAGRSGLEGFGDDLHVEVAVETHVVVLVSRRYLVDARELALESLDIDGDFGERYLVVDGGLQHVVQTVQSAEVVAELGLPVDELVLFGVDVHVDVDWRRGVIRAGRSSI